MSWAIITDNQWTDQAWPQIAQTDLNHKSKRLTTPYTALISEAETRSNALLWASGDFRIVTTWWNCPSIIISCKKPFSWELRESGKTLICRRGRLNCYSHNFLRTIRSLSLSLYTAISSWSIKSRQRLRTTKSVFQMT